MSGYDDIELRLTDWLEEGPVEVPDAPIAAALAHARAHPRRRWSVVGHWRTLMSGTNMTHVRPRSNAGWLVAAAAVVLVVAVAGGYGFLQSNNPGVGLGGAGSPEPTATPSPTTTVIIGTEACSAVTAATTMTVDGVDASRGERYDCSTTMSDPRLTGDGTAILNSDQQSDGTWLGWGTREITNEGGTWRGPFMIRSTASARTMRFDVVLMGEDGYAGLVFRGNAVMSAARTRLTGIVIPVGPPITGQSTNCLVRSSGTDTVVGEITATRGARLECIDVASDRRISGTTTVDINGDLLADGSGLLWGTQFTHNTGGAWQGFWLGTQDPGGTTHHVEALLHGSGDYAGLLLRQSGTGDAEAGEGISWIVPSR
ncbi:MAG TPA: hypothetical protein VFW02_02435 [Candidatus Limnocylindrales bacterium]|nr:hypothetical protein [Candidatus Limnocylindrales bacterium]